MAYNKTHKLDYYKKVQDIVKQHHIDGLTILKSIFYMYVYDKYPMSYNTFLKINKMKLD